MRKILSMLMVVCMSFCLVSTSVSAAESVPDVSPCYNYTNSIRVTCSSAGTNSVKYSCTVSGKSGVTAIKIYLYLEEYYGGEWTGVDATKKSTETKTASVSDTYTSAVPGRKYRAYANVYVYKGSAYEKISNVYSATIIK